MSSTVYVPGAASFDHVVFATWLAESTGGACIAAKQSKDKKFFSVEFKSGTPPTHGVVNNLLIPFYPSAEALPTLYNAKVEDLPFGSIPEVLDVLKAIGPVAYTQNGSFYGQTSIWNGTIHFGIWSAKGFPEEFELRGTKYYITISQSPPTGVGFTQEGRDRLRRIQDEQKARKSSPNQNGRGGQNRQKTQPQAANAVRVELAGTTLKGKEADKGHQDTDHDMGDAEEDPKGGQASKKQKLQGGGAQPKTEQKDE